MTVQRPPAPSFVVADGHRLEYLVVQPGRTPAVAPRIVLLHEGLGCIRMWRDFPQRLAAALGEPVLVYSRYGYGGSDVLAEPRTDRFMHEEARTALPALLEALSIASPVLVGHSDGASIALLHAAFHPGVARAVVAMAPHLFVEPICVESIAQARAAFDHGDLASRLARYHTDAARTFAGWADTWLSGRFLAWNIEPEVARIRCPILAIQGEQDQYGTMRQIRRIAELAPQARLLELPQCRHSPHLDRPDEVLAAIAGFVAGLHA